MDFVAIILFFWSRWLATKPGTPRWLRFIGPALIINFFAALGLTIFGLMAVFRSVAKVDAAHKARALSDGIASAMNFTAAGLVFDALVLVTLVIFTVRLRSAA